MFLYHVSRRSSLSFVESIATLGRQISGKLKETQEHDGEQYPGNDEEDFMYANERRRSADSFTEINVEDLDVELLDLLMPSYKTGVSVESQTKHIDLRNEHSGYLFVWQDWGVAGLAASAGVVDQWHRKWFFIHDGKLFSIPTGQDTSPTHVCDLLIANVREGGRAAPDKLIADATGGQLQRRKRSNVANVEQVTFIANTHP